MPRVGCSAHGRGTGLVRAGVWDEVEVVRVSRVEVVLGCAGRAVSAHERRCVSFCCVNCTDRDPVLAENDLATGVRYTV